MRDNHFDHVGQAYEAMIDWDKRLGHETPFYRWLFERLGAASVLDAACGTGHHACLFHSWHLRVQGADISPSMIERSRQRCAGVDWQVRGFHQPVPAQSFDVVICVGNSLALAGDLQVVSQAIGQMLAAVRPGGALLVHVMNLWKLPEATPLWQKCLRANLNGRDSLIIKGVHRCGDHGYVDLLVTDVQDRSAQLQTHCAPFLGLDADLLRNLAHQAGAKSTELFGGYDRSEYDPATSTDLILLALK